MIKRYAIFLLLGPALIALIVAGLVAPLGLFIQGRPYSFDLIRSSYILEIYGSAFLPMVVLCAFDSWLGGVRHRIAIIAMSGFLSAAALRTPALSLFPGWWQLVPIALIGAIPAAICAWVAGEPEGPINTRSLTKMFRSLRIPSRASIRSLRRQHFAEILEKDQNNLFNAEYFKQVSDRLNSIRALNFKAWLTSTVLLAFVVLGFFFPEISFSPYGFSSKNSAAIREVVLFAAVCIGLFELGLSLRLTELEDILEVYSDHVAKDNEVASYFKAQYGLVELSEPLAVPKSKTVITPKLTMAMIAGGYGLFIIQFLMIPLLVSGIVIYVALQMWFEPGLPVWLSRSIIVYALLANVAAILVAIIQLYPFKHFETQPMLDFFALRDTDRKEYDARFKKLLKEHILRK